VVYKKGETYLPYIYDSKPVGLKPLSAAAVLLAACWQVSLD